MRGPQINNDLFCLVLLRGKSLVLCKTKQRAGVGLLQNKVCLLDGFIIQIFAVVQGSCLAHSGVLHNLPT